MLKNKRLVWLVLFILFLGGFLLRFYRLDAFPPGLNIDETAIGYNAFSILETGKDEYGVSYPLYFKSFNDHKLPVYIYSTALAIKAFGMNAFAVRFLSCFFGTLTILTVFFLVYLLSKRKDVALLASFLLAINPWHFFFSRVSFEVNVAISLLTLGITLFVFALEKRKFVLVTLLLGTVCFVLAMYCYNVTRILSPLLYLALVFYYRKGLLKVANKYYGFIFLLWIVSLFPFAMTLFKTSGITTQKGVLIFGGEKLATYVLMRSYILDISQIAAKLLFNSPIQIAWEYLRNIVSFFSVDFFFLKGAHHPINGTGNFGMFHLLEVVTIPLGIVLIIRKKLTYFYVILLWAIVVILLASITNEIPHPTRTYGVLIPCIIFSALGMSELLKYIFSYRNVWVRRLGVLLLCLFFSYSSLYYFASYFLRYAKEQAVTYRAIDKELVTYLKSQEKNYEAIVIDEDADVSYTSLLFYTQYPPAQYHKNAVYGRRGELDVLQKLDKYQYRRIEWEVDRFRPHTLYVTKKTEGFKKPPIKTFYFPKHPVVLYYDSKLGVYPSDEVAYQVYSGDTH